MSYRDSHAKLVVLALARRPHTRSELREILALGLPLSNPIYADIASSRLQQAVKLARRDGYRITYCGENDTYTLKPRNC